MLIFAVAALFAVEGASGQHTLGVIGGYGMGSGRFAPKQGTRALVVL